MWKMPILLTVVSICAVDVVGMGREGGDPDAAAWTSQHFADVLLGFFLALGAGGALWSVCRSTPYRRRWRGDGSHRLGDDVPLTVAHFMIGVWMLLVT